MSMTCDKFLDAKAAYKISSQVTVNQRDSIIANLNSQIKSVAEKGYFRYTYHFSELIPEEVVGQVNMIFTDAGYRIYKRDKFSYTYSWGKED